MTENRNVTQIMEYGRLLGINELMSYTSLGKNNAQKLGQNANAMVRFGKRVLYDRKKIDEWIDRQSENEEA